MIERTTTCNRYGHPEFRISFDGSMTVDPDVSWLVGTLEESVARGERFASGETFQIGWMITMLRSNDDETISILEPDMSGRVPIEWVDSVSHTLRHLRMQKDVVESVLAPTDMSFPSIRQSAIVCNRLGLSDGFMMSRSDPTGADSGWFCGCNQNHDHQDVDELKCLSLYESALRIRPSLIPYFALPPGVLVKCEPSKPPAVFLGTQRLELAHGSFLGTMYANM